MAFEFIVPQTADDALALWHDQARWFAGGTDLLSEIKTELLQPVRLIDLKRLNELRGIHETDDEARIGALTTLAEVAGHDGLRSRYPVLAEACAQAASPQLRNVATIGGNLNQDSRCPYYRGSFDCWLKGGDTCYLRPGQNREAAILGYHECVHVHPSDPANALVALEATVAIRGPHGSRQIAASQFFRVPHDGDRRMNDLQPGELVAEIRLPKLSGSRSIYLKAMDRAVWTFALVSVAVRLDFEAGRVRTARVVLGGVAPVPWSALQVERLLEGQVLDEGLVSQAAGRAVAGARPLTNNRYKLRLAQGLVRRALITIA